MGFALRPDAWGVGYGLEMVRLLISVGFDDLGLHRIWGARSPLNDASAKTIYARKREQSLERLEVWRRRYREVFAERGAIVISTEAPPEFSAAEASAAVWRVLAARRRW